MGCGASKSNVEDPPSKSEVDVAASKAAEPPADASASKPALTDAADAASPPADGAPPAPTTPSNASEDHPPADLPAAVVARAQSLRVGMGSTPGIHNDPLTVAARSPSLPPLRPATTLLRPSSAPGTRPPLASAMSRLPPLVPIGSKSLGAGLLGRSAAAPSPLAVLGPVQLYGTDVRPAMQVPRLAAGPLSCLAPRPAEALASDTLPATTQMHIQNLLDGAALDAQCRAATHLRELLCGEAGHGAHPVGARGGAAAPAVGLIAALVEAGTLRPLVALLREGPDAARLDAAWALTNVASSPDYAHSEALCNESAAEALVAVLGQYGGGGGEGAGGASAALAEQAVWALGNIAGALHPEMKTQALAAEVLDCGALKHVLAIVTAQADVAAAAAAAAADGSRRPGAAPLRLLRCSVWCLHNLAKHKHEKDMVDAIPVATRLLLECEDAEVLTCCAWVLAYLGVEEGNKSHMKQALQALPRLVTWVREARSSLATPSLLCLGTMCTGYMRALDYSGDVVDAGGVPAMLAYLKRAFLTGQRPMVKEALFVLSNVAGANNATVRALLDAGAFPQVLSVLRSKDLGPEAEEIRTECLYVLTNPWDPLVGVDPVTSQGLVSSGILEELHELLDPTGPEERLGLLLKGLADGIKRGQQLMTHAAAMLLVEHGDAAADMPQPANPVVELYVSLGTVDKIRPLNSHPNEDVATRANGILTVLQFFLNPGAMPEEEVQEL